VVLISEAFVGLAETIAMSKGFAALPHVAFPREIDWKTPQELDVITEAIAAEVVRLLTSPPPVTMGAETDKPDAVRSRLPDDVSLEGTDSLEATYRLVMEKRWGDGLPVVPPTRKRVEAMTDFLGQPPERALGEMPPLGREVTLEKLAVNAVMAGCLPEYFSVVVAAVEAMLDPAFNLGAIQCTTNPVGPVLVINGPVRKTLNINCTDGCMGPGWRANATIGRAIRLILNNIGGALPGDVDKAIHGMPGKYTFCFGEDEEGSPWEPLHVERGFRKEQSTVTVAGVQGTHNSLCRVHLGPAFLRLAAHSMCTMGNNNMVLGGGEPIAVFSSGHGRILDKEGFSKKDVKRFLFEHARVPLSQVYPPDLAENGVAGKGFIVIDGKAVPCRAADDIMVVIAGARNPAHLVTMPTFGETRAVTRVIQGKV